MQKKLFSIFLLAATLGFTACHQPEPPAINTEEKGDIAFSGYQWKIKSTEAGQVVGPGPNVFSRSLDNVWLDANNMLHLKITKVGSQWRCSEVVSTKEFGYGTYIFTTASDLTTLNERAVLGLFTWNDYSFQTQGNSEIDVEFARWGDSSDTSLLTYSVQPVWFSQPAPYIERTRRPAMQVSKLKKTCIHVFKWTADLVTWASYEGEVYPTNNLPLASWSYDKSNRTRQKLEGNQVSNPIVIPAPEDSTNVRFNLWLLNGQGPANNSQTEVVIKDFRFIPL